MKGNLREKVQNLRKQGKTYSEIQKALKIPIPKSTLSFWCRHVNLPKGYYEKIRKLTVDNTGKEEKPRGLLTKSEEENISRQFGGKTNIFLKY